MDVKMESQLVNQMGEAVKRLRGLWNYNLVAYFANMNTAFQFTPMGSIQRKWRSVVNSVINEIVEQNKCALIKLDTTESNDHKEKTLFAILWKAFQEEQLTQKDICYHIFTIVNAASNSSAITMNFVIFALANFPEIQEKVYKELSKIYGTKSPKSLPVKYEDLQHMDYLNRVIKETMRLFPVGPVIGRLLTEDLKIGEFTLPKGADVLISIIDMHRNKKYWSNPLTFDPDRFLRERKMDSSNYYIPFSDGLRNCLGQNYAMMSMKVILVTLIRTFKFEIEEKVEIDKIKLNTDFTIYSIDPIKIKIDKRNLQ